MSSTTGRWREDQVLVVCPGSHTTTAQLGCNELTTPQHRFPTRVFWDDDAGAFRPVRTFRRRREVPAVAGVDGDDEEFEWVEDPDSAEGAVYPLVGGWETEREREREKTGRVRGRC
jgi:actin-related protein 9